MKFLTYEIGREGIEAVFIRSNLNAYLFCRYARRVD